VDGSHVTGLDFIDDARAVTALDWDRDGDLDLWFKNRSGPQLRFLLNEQTGGAGWLALRLEGRSGNRNAIGARVELHAGGLVRHRSVVSGEGYLSQSSRWLHFGLGQTAVDRLVVHWPAGGSQTLGPLESGRRYRLREGDAEAIAETLTVPTLAPPPPFPPMVAGSTAVLLKEPLPLPPSLLALRGPEEEGQSPVLLNLWAQWCEPCLTELDGFSSQWEQFDSVGLKLVALSVDDDSALDTAEKLFAERFASIPHGATYRDRRDFVGGEQTLDALLRHILGRHGELTLPTSLLIDAQGRIQLVYLGPVEAERLVEDMRWLDPSVKPWLRSRWAGRWYARTPRDYEGLAAELRKLGRSEDAAFYDRMSLRSRTGGGGP